MEILSDYIYEYKGNKYICKISENGYYTYLEKL